MSKGLENFKNSMHLGMGAVYIVAGIAVLYFRYFGALQLSAGLAYGIGALMLVYGVFRIWRGFVGMRRRAQ